MTIVRQDQSGNNPAWPSEALMFLANREELNRSQLKRLDLIGELGTSTDELELLGRAIRSLVMGFGPKSATRLLDQRFSVCLAEFLVGSGTYYYEHGDYWSSVVSRIGLPRQNYASAWGDLFEKVLDRYGLEQFTLFDVERATRYVSRILAHGGIPQYCLDDFFEHLVLPTVLAGEHRTRLPEDIIQSWCTSGTILTKLDQPVRRFLVYGGDVAADVLGRCLDMADLAVRGHDVSDAAELGLPERVVDHFTGWFAHRGNAASVGRDLTTTRLTPAKVSYDPWAPDALSLLLPAQSLSGPAGQVRWTISAGGWTRTVDVRSKRRGTDIVTSAVEVRLPTPFERLEVTFEAGDERLLHRRFTGLTADHPFLAFLPGSGQLVETDNLPREELWLITKLGASISVEARGQHGEVPVLEELPFLAGEWSPFRGQHVDLTEWDVFRLDQGGNANAFPLGRSPRLRQRAQLVGGERSPLAVATSTDHAYVGRPPELRLPLPVRAGVKASADRWHVRVRSLAGAHPLRETSFAGDDPLLVEAGTGDELSIDLSSPELLGEEPLGEFEIVAHGPLGHDARFELAFPPDLAITGLTQPLLPDDHGPVPVGLRIRTPGHFTVTAKPESDVSVKQLGAGHVAVEASRSTTELGLLVRDSKRHRQDQVLALYLPLRRVRWAVTALTDHAYELADRPLFLSQDELQQAEAPALVVAVPAGAEPLWIGARLEDVAGTCLFRFDPRQVSTGRRFPLHALADTLRSRADARLRLMVTIEGGNPPTVLGSATAAVITKELQVSELRLIDLLTGASRSVDLRWTERQPVTNRVVRFWPLWRPWESHPREFVIDDAARGGFAVQTARALLPAGQYRVELAVRDPWVQAIPVSMPPPDAGNVADTTIGNPEEHAEYLDELPQDEPLGILERFLATREPGVLDLLSQTLNGHEVQEAIAAALGLQEIDVTGSVTSRASTSLAIRELGEVLRRRPELLSAIADLSEVDALANHRLRRLIVDLGHMRRPMSDVPSGPLTDRQRLALWRLWSPMLFALDGERLLHDDPTFHATALSLLGVEELTGDAQEADALKRIERAIGSRFQFGGTELSRDLETLRGIRDSFGVVQTGPLNPDAWTLANLDWLIRMRTDRDAASRAEAWLSSHLYLAKEDLAALSRAGLCDAVARIEGRWPTADHGPIRMLPFIVGATALVERALSRNVLHTSMMMRDAARGHHPAREAFAAAMELYSRDLCVMDVLILSACRQRENR